MQRPLKIVYVTTDLRVGGAEGTLTRLAVALSETHDITIVSLLPAEAYVGQLRKEGITVVELRFHKIRGVVTGLLQLAKLIAKNRPDVVQGWMYHGDLAALISLILSGRRKRTRLIWSIRCSNMDLRHYRIGLRLVVRACSLLSRYPDLVTANSAAGLVTHLALGYRPRRATILRNGIDVNACKPDAAVRHEARVELCIPNEAVVLAHVARVDPMKDHGGFLEAMSELPHVSALLIGLGTENLPTAAPNILKLGLRKDVARLFAAADFVVSSSRFGEGFSNAVAEGMACGLPPIATDVGDAMWIVGDTGLVVPPGSPAALAAAIRALVSESATARIQRSAKARARIVENFSITHSVARYLELYASFAPSAAVASAERTQTRLPKASSRPSLNCSPRRRRVMFLYWGQRGAMSRFTLSLANAAKAMHHLEAIVSVSRQNELFGQFVRSEVELFPINAFSSRAGAFTRLDRLVALRKSFADYLRTRKVDAVVTLMPHIWSPLVTGIAQRQGIPYTVVVHDAKRHIGDPTSLVNRWLFRDAYRADRIVTLSRSVRDELIANSWAPERLVTLFLPNLCDDPRPRRRDAALPLRLLFFGRILPYKGLPLFVSALEMVRARGIPIEIGVFGEGELGQELRRLKALKAKVINFWIPESEIDTILTSYDVLVLSHIEASQSGVAALALGSCLPIVTTPIGGLTEQITHEVNGLIADAVTPAALAAQICRLATDPALYDRLSHTILRDLSRRSMRVFLERLVDCTLSSASTGVAEGC